MRVEVTDTVRDDLPVVTVAGELDWEAVGAFRAALEEHLPADAEVVLVDLVGVESWNAPAQAALVRVTKECRRAGRWVAVFGLGELPRRQLAATALAVGLNVYDSEQEARAALRAASRRGRRGRGHGHAAGGPATTGTSGTTGTGSPRGHRDAGYPGDARYLASTRTRPATGTAAGPRPRRPR